MAATDVTVLRQISAAVVALHASIETFQRTGDGRKTAPELISAARAVRDMQDAIAALQREEERPPGA